MFTFKTAKKSVMKKLLFLTIAIMAVNASHAQKKTNQKTALLNPMTPETLWKLGRVTGLGLSQDNKSVIYKVVTPVVEENISSTQFFSVSIDGGTATQLKDYKS